MIQQRHPERDRRPAAWLPAVYADAALAVDAHQEGESQGRYLSDGCRNQLDSNAHYRFVVVPNTKQFVLERWDGDTAVTLIPWEVSPAVRPGDQTNRLELSCAGSTIAASLNGTPLASVQDSTYREGLMWVGAGSSADLHAAVAVRIDNLVVIQR